MLYHQGIPVQLLGMLAASISAVVFWDVAGHAMLGLWLAVHIAFSMMRIAATVKFNRSEIVEPHVLDNWGYAYVVGTFISGVIWGSLCLFLDPAWPATYQIALFVIYTGIIAGAFNSHSSFFMAFLAFYLPPVIWITYTMLNQAGAGYAEITMLCVIYIVLMYVSALKFNNRLAQTLGMRFENERLAAELSQINQQLERLADTDQLTGLGNRRSMDRGLAREWNRHYRTYKPLSLLFMDVDFFKQYNDTYGHEDGDQCLIRIGKILVRHPMRSSDMAARFGGEEFALILPETEEEDATRIAEAIMAELEKAQIQHSSSTVSKYVTMSIGVATVTPDRPGTGNPLLLSADRALYQAKKTGRNRVVRASQIHE